MKHLCTILATVFSFSLFAAPMATVDWVKQYVAKLTSTKAPVLPESPSARPASVSETFSSSMVAEDGSAWDVTMALKSSSDISLIVTGSTVPDVTNGTVYAWNGELSAFESSNPYMPVIKADTFGAARPVTNLAGVVSIVTNTVTHYTAQTSDGVDFWSATYFATDYLVSAAGFSGPRLAYVVSSSPASSSSASRLARGGFSLIPSAMADDFSAPAAFAGSFYIGEVVIKRKGGNESYILDHTYRFHSGVGSGSIAEFTAEAFSKWYASPQGGVFQEYAGRLIARLDDYQAGWGMGKPNDVIDLGNDQLEIRYGDLYYRCEAFKSLIGAAKQAVEAEFSRQFMHLYNKLKEHPCPSLAPGEEEWTIEMECKCRYTYPDILTGEDIACLRADVSSHDFRRYKLVGGRLVLSDDGAGCLICSRCFEHRDGIDGVEHVEVPESAEYCGCYCGYYYEKKESDSSGESEGAETPIPPIYGGGEVIEKVPEKEKEDVEIECKGPDGDTVSVPVSVEVQSWHLVTNDVSGDKIPWRHVSRTVMGANGRLIKVTTSAEGLMSTDDGRLKHRKPQNPLSCTCKCGVEHFFKPSPCPEICRGCRKHEDCFQDLGDGRQIWYGHSSVNNNIDILGHHCKFEDGYWDEETYSIRDAEGTEREYTWSNKNGGYDQAGNLHILSPYAAWYGGITTNGVAACGCACKRFFTDSSGACGAPGKDLDGEEVNLGHHMNFHCYSLKRAADIKCPFTRYYYETTDPDALLPSCACQNHAWEEENDPAAVGESTLYETGWVGSYKRGADAGSLACDSACRWCWPHSHGISQSSETALDWKKHTGIALMDKLDQDVARVYAAWIDSVGTLECGCLCQALGPGACAVGDGSSNGGDYSFPVTWEEITSENYHFCDYETSCVCSCGLMHLAVTPTSREKYRAGETPPWNWSRCSAGMGVCQLCGYYDRSGVLDNLNRADPDCHVFIAGCRCDCSSDGGDARFRPKKGYDSAVRGWSAAQDRDNYPNNTRSASPGYRWREADIFENCHRDADGHFCPCNKDVGHHLYHKHKPGDFCVDCCKVDIDGYQCNHVEDYYVFNHASGNYEEKTGEHFRSFGADYCGCDCGERVYRIVDGKQVPWHVAPDGECYCCGKYSPTSPWEHGDARLMGHINLQPTGNIVSNRVSCSYELCDEGWWECQAEFKCQNEHVVYGKVFVADKNCDHGGVPDCSYCTCAACLERNRAGFRCECPFCNGIAAADRCTCEGADGGSGENNGTVKFTSPYLTVVEIVEILADVDFNEVSNIDGDDPVYEIEANAFYQKLCNMPSLTTVKFNYVTNVGDFAFGGALRNCPNLNSVQFARLKSVGSEAFQNAFAGSAVTHLSLPSLTSINGARAFSDMGIVSIAIPAVRQIPESTFSGCTKLTTIEGQPTYIDQMAFWYCQALKNLDTSKVSFIGLVAFRGCGLETISLPAVADFSHIYRAFEYSAFKDISLPSISTNLYFTCKEDVYNWGNYQDPIFPSGCTVHFADGDVVIP